MVGRSRVLLDGGWRDRVVVSDETRARAAAVMLWVLLALAVIGGLMGWVRHPATAAPPDGDVARETVSGSWSAAGFGARFVSAYLSVAPDDADALADFLGYAPDLPATTRDAPPEEPVVAVAVEPVGERYWAVTVAAGPAATPEFWQVGVREGGGQLVAAGMPTPAPAPTMEERVDLSVPLSHVPPGDDPVVETVAGFVAAYACGQGELDRYLAPDVELRPTGPVCSSAELDRWGSRPLGEARQEVVAEAVLDPGPSARRVTFALSMSRRDGRWEIAELQPAPSLAGD